MTDRSNQNWPTEETYELDIRDTRSNDRVLVCNNRLRDVKTEYKGWPTLDLAATPTNLTRECDAVK